jgi:polyphosphate kinase 2
MKYLKYYDNYEKIDESISSVFNNIIDKIKSVFKSKSYEVTKDELINILNTYKTIFLEKETDRKELNSIISKLKKELGSEIVLGLNLDNFFRGIYNITIKEKNKEKKLESYFRKYIKTLEYRLQRIYDKDYWKDQFKDDEEFAQLKKLKKENVLKIGKNEFIAEKEILQVELLKMQEHIKENGEKVVILFEGRDAAGKGSAIKTITEYLDPKFFEVAVFGIPTPEEQQDWFKRYIDKLPKPGHITFYDRSWYNRAVNDPVMGYCNETQYRHFMAEVNDFENNLIDDGFTLIKFWFSIEKSTQLLRFKLRKASPLKYWKYSPNDEKTIPKWDIFTKFKEQMFQKTSTEKSPWVIVDSNDKRLAKLNVMRYILNKVEYGNDKTFEVFPEVVFELK